MSGTAAVIITIVLALAIPATAYVVAHHMQEVTRLALRHMERTQTIGGEPVRLRNEALEHRFEMEAEEARHKREIFEERRRAARSPLEQVIGG